MNEIHTPGFSFAQGYSRRSFLRRSGLIAALTPAAAMLLGGTQNAAALPFPPGRELDVAILNFALNLEFLEGEYYTRGVTGQGLAASGVTVSGGQTAGNVIAGSNTQVPFQSAALQSYAAEIAQDEQNHIAFLQNVISDLGGTPVAEPDIDLVNSFNAISNMAGLGASFNPFANEVNFFLGGYSLTDVGVTAYRGAAPSITDKTVLSGSAGILAVEAYHAATLRVSIYAAGTDARNMANAVSAVRDQLDDNGRKDSDQGVTNADGTANIVPTDANSLAFARNPRRVLNIVYGQTKATNGGFFPSGLHGDIK